MKHNYTCREFNDGNSQIEFINVADMSALIRSIENELSQLECSLSLANPGGDVYKDEYQLRMNTTIGTALIDVSLVDDILIIRATTDLVNQLEILLQESSYFIKNNS